MNKMASTAKQRFDAAIKVIHSLPKDGPFQPSNEMMLTFYGYFKQATEGPCKASKPNFWEIVKKAKWDAWQKLGSMDQETAMDLYVEELKKTLRVCTDKWNEMDQNNDPRIVEAMPQTNVVGNFMETLGTFYEMVDEEPPMKGVVVPSKKPPDSNSNIDLDPITRMAANGGDVPADMSQIVESALKTYSHVEEDPHTAVSKHSTDTPLTNGPVAEVKEDMVNGRGDSSESFGNNSFSESEDEFCDTSDNPAETVDVVKPKLNSKTEVQMSTPLKDIPTSQRVHFADPPSNSVHNGRISPILQEDGQYVSMPPGFPYISKNVDRELSDSMVVSAGDSSVNTLSYSQFTQGEDVSSTDFSSNNSSYIALPKGMRRAEGGDEPEENRRAGRQGNKQGQSSSPGKPGARRGNFSGSSSGRRALLTGGAAGGGGEDNPPQGQSGPQDGATDELSVILIKLQQDMTSILERLNRLETEIRQKQRQEGSLRNRVFQWWPLKGRTGRTAFFILVWPVIVHLVLSYIFRRRRRNN